MVFSQPFPPPTWCGNEKLSWITKLILYFFPMLYHKYKQSRPHTTALNLSPQRYQSSTFSLFSRRALPLQQLLPSLLITCVQCSNLINQMLESCYCRVEALLYNIICDFSPSEDGVVVVNLRLSERLSKDWMYPAPLTDTRHWQIFTLNFSF